MDVGYKIKTKRLLKGYTQHYMAESLGISQKTYSNLENSRTKISLSTLEQIASILEIDFFDLLPDNISISHNEFKDQSAGYVVNNIPEKLIEQYEERIKEKEKIISLLEEKIMVLQETKNKS